MDISILTIRLETSLEGKSDADLDHVNLITRAGESSITMVIELWRNDDTSDERYLTLDKTPDTENVLANTFMLYATLLQVKEIKLEYDYVEKDAKTQHQTFTLKHLREMLIEDRRIAIRYGRNT